MIIAGTCYEYGLISGKIKESFKCKPACHYGSGKNSLRKFIFSLQRKYKFKLTWLRIFYIYGKNPSRNTLTNILLKNKKTDKPIILNRKIKRDYVDIKVVSNTFVKILKKDKNYGVINLSSGRKVSLKELVKFLSKKYKINPSVKYKDTLQRSFEPEIFYGDNDKLKEIMVS